MESRLALVIEGDEHTANRLAAAIREADYEVVVSPTAEAGLDIAIEIKPDCLLCDVDLPDQEGYWVARNIRSHGSPVSVTPLLLLSAYDDAASRIEGLQAGADVYLTKPFRVEEVVAQVDALVQMAARLRQRREAVVSIAPGAMYGSTAIEGDLRQMSIATVLSVLGMERRTGVFEVVSKKRRAQVEISGGYVVHGTIGGTRVNALAATRVMLGWNVGRFAFTPLPPYELPPSLRTVQALLLDAAKAEDEAAAAVPASMRFDGQVVSSSFGGPASRPDDTAPPSSRAMREAAVRETSAWDGTAGPVSLSFDLIPSRRADESRAEEMRAQEMPAAEVTAAVDAPLAAFEKSRPAPPPSAPRKPPARKVPPPRIEVAKPGPPPLPIALDLDEAFARPDEEVISIAWEEVEPESYNGERMLQNELTPSTLPGLRRALSPFAPTPPAGTPIPQLRRTAAIVPPPDSSAAAHARPLPPPPATPRPFTIPSPPSSRAADSKPRTPRINPKKA